jgi:hypothetical protein
MVLDTDNPAFGGHNRLSAGQVHHTFTPENGAADRQVLSLYLPARTGIVLQAV